MHKLLSLKLFQLWIPGAVSLPMNGEVLKRREKRAGGGSRSHQSLFYVCFKMAAHYMPDVILFLISPYFSSCLSCALLSMLFYVEYHARVRKYN